MADSEADFLYRGVFVQLDIDKAPPLWRAIICHERGRYVYLRAPTKEQIKTRIDAELATRPSE
jgi:hypothetical protein